MIVSTKLKISSSGFFLFLSLIGATWTLPVSHDAAQLAPTASAQADWRCVSVSTTGQYQTAGTSFYGIYTSSDYGATWTIADRPLYDGLWYSVGMSSDSDGKDQTAVDASGGIYTSSNYGATWTMALPLTEVWGSVSLRL